MKMNILFKITFLIASLSILCVSCAPPQTNTGKGAAYGAAGGAVAGAAGAGVGKMMDDQERDMRETLAASEAAAIRREGDLLAISLKGDVTFDYDSAILRPGLYSEIDRISNVLIKYPETVIRVEGHTDSTGSENYNMVLSQRRADSVKNLIVQRGVSLTRIETMPYGESMPIADNSTEAGRSMNRRVEIKIAPTQY